MTSISEARAEVHRQVKQLIATVDRAEAQSATAVEVALWAGMLAVG